MSATTSDIYDQNPSNRYLVGGVTYFMITPVTMSTQTITVTDTISPYMDANVSDQYTVDSGQVARLQILVPGEYAVYGSTSGKSGNADTQTAGKSFNVTVNATDNYFNKKASYNDNVGVRVDTSDDWDIHPATQPLTNGSTIFAVTLVTKGTTHKLYAVDTDIVPDGYLLNKGTSTAVTVVPNIDPVTDLKLQLLVPGEQVQEGKWDNGVNPSPFGKTQAAPEVTAGSPFMVTANLVDKYWNKVDQGVTMQWVELMKVNDYDQYSIYPSSKQLVNGTTTFSVELRTSGFDTDPSSWTITLRDVDPTAPSFAEIPRCSTGRNLGAWQNNRPCWKDRRFQPVNSDRRTVIYCDNLSLR